MTATIYFLVRVEESYNNFVDLGNGVKLSKNNSIDDVESINRVGKIIGAPKGTVAVEGDYILFHHNICRQAWGFKGKKRVSNYAITDKEFFVPVAEVFMYMKEDTEKWQAVAPFVFIKPIPAEKITLSNGLQVEEESYKGFKPLVGEVAYSNKQLEKEGVEEGDTIAFQQDSEHEYKLKGEIYYKMKNQDILAIL
tara:strand:- start:1809 stop:2393 length:585 start_codon:yes stop_codon:yes gene_type:complete